MPRFPDNWKNLKVALSHDWLTGMRGGERVLEILCNAFPSAPIYTLIHNRQAVSDIINSHDIRTSWLQHIPGVFRHYRRLLPLFPSAIERMPAPEADIIISASHCVAKGLKKRPGSKHLCYCFTPMRYAWTFFDEYFGGNPVKRLLANMLLPSLRKWDRESSAQIDRFVAISGHVKKRIEDFYGRDADVVYPPVDTEKWVPAPGRARENYDLIVSALVPYKKLELAVSVYSKIKFPLRIVGTGSESPRLRAMAGANIEFLGWRSDEEIATLYQTCRKLIFPGEEDFGLVPLEAQACGAPVVAYRKGGALETVVDGKTGVFFDTQTEDALLDAVAKCSAIAWDPTVIRANAERFGVQSFVDGLARSIDACLSGRSA